MATEKPSFDWLHKDVVNNAAFSSAFEKEYRKLFDSKSLPREHHLNPSPTVLEEVSKEFHPYLLGEKFWQEFLKQYGLDDDVLEQDVLRVVKMLIDGGELQEEAKNLIQAEIARGSVLGRAFELTARFETTLVDHWFGTFEARKREAASSFNQKWRGEDHDLYVAVYGSDLIDARNQHLKKKNLEAPPKVVAEGSGIILQGHFSYEEGKPYSDIRNFGFLVLAGASVETSFPGQIFFINFEELKVPSHLRRKYDERIKEDYERLDIPVPKESEIHQLDLEYPKLEKEDSWASPPNKVKPFVEKDPSFMEKQTSGPTKQYLPVGQQPPQGLPIYQGPRGGHYFFTPPKQHGGIELRNAPFTLESSRKEAIKFFGEGGDEFLSRAFAVDVPGYSSKIIHAERLDEGRLETLVNLYDSSNKRIGYLDRSFFKDSSGISANHNRFALNTEHQGKGIASSMIQNAEEAYRQSGIRTINLTTGWSVGGYAWALQGYDFQAGSTELHEMQKHFGRIIKSLAVQESLGQYGAFQKKFPRITVDKAKEMIDSVNGMKHSWEFARYNPFGNRHGDHLGKAAMLGTSWAAQKNLDENSEGYKIGQAYFGAKNKVGAIGG